jgi:hypothetical protein
MTDEIISLADLIPDPRNARKHNPRNVNMITDAIHEVGVSRSGVIDEHGNILAGNGTYEALAEAGIDKIKVVEADGKEWVVVKRTGLTAEQKAKLAIYDNRTAELAHWDPKNLGSLLDDFPSLVDKMFSDEELRAVLDGLGDGSVEDIKDCGSLSRRFLVPPFSVLNARDGDWQNRKRFWRELGIKSEMGRDGCATGGALMPAADQSGRRAMQGGKTVRGNAMGQPITQAESFVKVKISAKSLRLKFNGCDPDFIKDVCHAHCCDTTKKGVGCIVTIHPTEEKQIEKYGAEVENSLIKTDGEKCPFKNEQFLCDLHHTPDKPFGCIVSPFKLNDNGTLIVRHRYIQLKCYDAGKRLAAYKAFRPSLDLLFGRPGAENISNHLDNGGGDLTVEISKRIHSMLNENNSKTLAGASK